MVGGDYMIFKVSDYLENLKCLFCRGDIRNSEENIIKIYLCSCPGDYCHIQCFEEYIESKYCERIYCLFDLTPQECSNSYKKSW